MERAHTSLVVDALFFFFHSAKQLMINGLYPAKRQPIKAFSLHTQTHTLIDSLCQQRLILLFFFVATIQW